jgi:hypothetical protein
MPVIKDSGAVQYVSLAGVPSKQITLSAMYVAIIKSCSTTKAHDLDVNIHLFMTLDAITLYSESK